MATYVITHDVDDVEHWANSPVREKFFGPMGISVRTFRTEGSNAVALVCEIPDMAAFQAAMQSPEAAAAMKEDGVHPDTLRVFAET
ncbi:MAG TPA: hypothetical protein VMZ00_05515 [Sporichthya sp.]|nr:hypothetical protein [Sporichthya sp.]